MNRVNPQTSHDAYRSVQNGMIGEHHKNIIAALRIIKSGMYEDIALYTGMEKHQIGRRLSELERMQIVYKPGEQRTTSTGRKAFIYKLVTQEPTQQTLFDNPKINPMLQDPKQQLENDKEDFPFIIDDDDENNFEPCDNCDLPDACEDFGCAIKSGIRKDEDFFN